MLTRYGLRMLLFLLLMLCAPPWATADTITAAGGSTFVFPNGSLVTAMNWYPSSIPPGEYGGYWQLDFTFADGYGVESGDYLDGEGGFLNFTVPVSDLQLTAVIGGSNFVLDAFYGNGGGSFFDCGYPEEACPVNPATFSFPGPDITSLAWGTAEGFSGISSMSYTTPEPGSIVLLGFGLLALVGLFWYSRSNRSRLRSN
jgi:hypothetical protein